MTTEATAMAIQEIPRAQLIPSKTNPRKRGETQALLELAASIRSVGILQPILARPANGHFEIVYGERRWKAAAMADLATIPTIVRELTDVEVCEMQLVENKLREDIHPLDEAEGYAHYIRAAKQAGRAIDADAIAAAIGMSKSHVYQRLQLLKLTDKAKRAFLDDELTAGHAVELARLTPADQARALKATLQEHFIRREDPARPLPAMEPKVKAAIPVRALRAWIATNVHLDLEKAPWDLTDDTLVTPKAGLCQGACTTCSYNTAVAPELFPEIQRKHGICINPAGYRLKQAAWLQRTKAAAEEQHHGAKVLELSTRQGYAETTAYPRLGTDWQKAGAKTCPDTKLGIIVDPDPYGRTGAKLGEVLPICTATVERAGYKRVQCPVHTPKEERWSDSPTRKAERKRQAQAQKARRELRDLRGDIYRALFAGDGHPQRADWLLLYDYCADALVEPAERQALGSLYGWTRPRTGYTARPSYGAARKAPELKRLEAKLATLSDRDLQRLVFATFLAGRVAANDNASRSDADPLLKAAKTHKVNVATIKRQAQAAAMQKRAAAAQAGMAKRLTPGRTVKALTDAAKGRRLVGRVRVGRRIPPPASKTAAAATTTTKAPKRLAARGRAGRKRKAATKAKPTPKTKARATTHRKRTAA